MATPIDIATKEVEIATQNCEDDYIKDCYLSALKAYKSLCEDGHSGCSFNITSNILKKLLDGKPLSPITENDFPEEPYWIDKDNIKHFQSNRKSSLFKYVYPDGTIKYTDNDRFYAYLIDKPNIPYHSGLVCKILDEMFPITMPYTANKNYAVATDEFLLDKKNGDFDHKAVLFIKEDKGETYEVNRYFKDSENDWIEISKEEYEKERLSRVD